jgi:hypothetical protein
MMATASVQSYRWVEQRKDDHNFAMLSVIM